MGAARTRVRANRRAGGATLTSERTFERRGDAATFDREVKRRKQLGELALWEQRNRTVRELSREWWSKYAVPNLAEHTLDPAEILEPGPAAVEDLLLVHTEDYISRLQSGELTAKEV